MTDEEYIKRLSDENSELKVLLWEARMGNNNKGIMLQHEILKDRYERRGEVLIQYSQEIEKLKEAYNELKSSQGTVTLRDGLNKLGSYVSQKTHLKVLEELKELKARWNTENGMTG
jgi:hypothetical protein